MKVFGAEQIRQWDQYTIREEPISSVNLMERAALACFGWMYENNKINPGVSFTVFCGKGNNGGDGLAIARLLTQKGVPVTIFILEFGHKGTTDFQVNLERLHQVSTDIHFIQEEAHFPEIPPATIILDALFGSGLSRPVDGLTEKLIRHINSSGAEIISIDIPSGLSTDSSSKGNTAIIATHTLSFQVYKPAFLLAENALYTGRVHILDIGLHKDYYEKTDPLFELIDSGIIQGIYRERNPFSHKGNFGHAALIAGSTGMMGAAVLAAKACMRSGAGKLTAYIPKSGYVIMQVSVPEVMARISGTGDYIDSFLPVAVHESLGVGPGMGVTKENETLLKDILSAFQKPIVLDADALTVMAVNKSLLKTVPPHSILTPHPREFERLFGTSPNEMARIQQAKEMAAEYNVIILLKGHHSFIALPDARGYFNNTGNAGMATAGSGDVLTGILTGLLAQGYAPAEAALLGVYLHGLAGDMAADSSSPEAMMAGDIIDCLGEAFNTIHP